MGLILLPGEMGPGPLPALQPKEPVKYGRAWVAGAARCSLSSLMLKLPSVQGTKPGLFAVLLWEESASEEAGGCRVGRDVSLGFTNGVPSCPGEYHSCDFA